MSEEELILEELVAELDAGWRIMAGTKISPETADDMSKRSREWQHGSVEPTVYCGGTTGSHEARAVHIWQHLMGDASWLKKWQ